MSKRKATSADVHRMVEFLYERSTPYLKSEECCDDVGFVFEPSRIIVRYSRMAFGELSPAFSALSWFIGDPFGAYRLDMTEIMPDSRFGEFLKGVVGALIDLESYEALEHACWREFD